VSETKRRKVLVLGYGNPGRKDDGLGPAAAEEIEKLGLNGVWTEENYQLNIEDAADAAENDLVIFVDAAEAGPEPFELRKIEPVAEATFTTHLIKPESVLAICRDTFGRTPEAWLVGIRGYEFEFEEGLTDKAKENLTETVEHLIGAIRKWKGKNMSNCGCGNPGKKKTILIIDDDPDLRATMRIVLESAGFAVGEASDGEEGLKVAERVRPDAILLDLMMETVDAGTKVSTKLKELGMEAPIYLLSGAGDAVQYNVDARELGLAGIFQKPIDHDALVDMLKTKLKCG
jgi:hydrogenase maturation protease